MEFLKFAEYLEKIDLQKKNLRNWPYTEKKICETGVIQKKKFAFDPYTEKKICI
jgi:hypothetical protein